MHTEQQTCFWKWNFGLKFMEISIWAPKMILDTPNNLIGHVSFILFRASVTIWQWPSLLCDKKPSCTSVVYISCAGAVVQTFKGSYYLYLWNYRSKIWQGFIQRMWARAIECGLWQITQGVSPSNYWCIVEAVRLVNTLITYVHRSTWQVLL